MALNIVPFEPGELLAEWCKEVGRLNRLDCTPKNE
jgi:hypothetical protein